MGNRVCVVLIVSDPPCPRCRELRSILTSLKERFEDRICVSELNVLDSAADVYGVVLTPALVIDDLVVSMGRVPPAERIQRFIEQRLQSGTCCSCDGG